MINKLINILTATKEQDAEYNGFLSHTGEWHGLTIGYIIELETNQSDKLIKALVFKNSQVEIYENTHLHDSRKELAYTLAGIILAKLHKKYK